MAEKFKSRNHAHTSENLPFFFLFSSSISTAAAAAATVFFIYWPTHLILGWSQSVGVHTFKLNFLVSCFLGKDRGMPISFEDVQVARAMMVLTLYSIVVSTVLSKVNVSDNLFWKLMDCRFDSLIVWLNVFGLLVSSSPFVVPLYISQLTSSTPRRSFQRLIVCCSIQRQSYLWSCLPIISSIGFFVSLLVLFLRE